MLLCLRTRFNGQRPAPRGPRRRAWLIFELFGFREGDLYSCTPRTAFVSSDLDLVKGYNSGAADTECKVTFTNGPETWPVGEFGRCASSGDVLSSRFVNGDEIFAGKVAEMGFFWPVALI